MGGHRLQVYNRRVGIGLVLDKSNIEVAMNGRVWGLIGGTSDCSKNYGLEFDFIGIQLFC